MLGWNQQELADAAGVAMATVQFFETDKRKPIPNNLTAIRRALEDAGVEFIPARSRKGVGVRLLEE
jgi:transcriptional regulator with XRE-family HTH domain